MIIQINAILTLKHMPRTKLKHLQTGEVISRDVTTANGRLLLTAGTVISTRHLEVLRTWGIVEVEIEGDEPEQAQTDIDFTLLPADIQAEIQHELDALFHHCDRTHPFIDELLRYQRHRISQHYHQGER